MRGKTSTEICFDHWAGWLWFFEGGELAELSDRHQRHGWIFADFQVRVFGAGTCQPLDCLDIWPATL